MTMKNIISGTLVIALLFAAGCKKDGDAIPTVDTTLNSEIISDFSLNIANAKYVALAAKTTLLQQQVATLAANPTDINLAICRQTWKDARQVWEQSEALLFGPVETDNIDPRIDTWPVNFTDLDAQLASGNAFTDDYINGLEDALKGFHPIEYIIFGTDGHKSAASLTAREIEYLTALTSNVQVLTANLASTWNTSSSSSFYTEFVSAGKGSTVYATQQAALEQMVTAMAGICDEVANGKMKEPFDAQDPSLEESPFSGNSMTDFTNNITGIQNVYLGKFLADGTGLEDLVKKYNLSLDSEIKSKLSAALGAMANVTHPFGQAILDQHVQVENAMSAINDLQTTLEDKLLPFVKQHSK